MVHVRSSEECQNHEFDFVHIVKELFLCIQVPVRVAGGLLFELLGQSAGDPFVEEDDIPVVLRSWQAQNFLLTALHVKGSASNINVLGIVEVQVCLSSAKSLATNFILLFLCVFVLKIRVITI